MLNIKYPWNNSLLVDELLILMAAYKRHGKGDSGGKGGQFAPKGTDGVDDKLAGIVLAHRKASAARVKASKLQKRLDNDPQNESLKTKLKIARVDESKLKEIAKTMRKDLPPDKNILASGKIVEAKRKRVSMKKEEDTKQVSDDKTSENTISNGETDNKQTSGEKTSKRLEVLTNSLAKKEAEFADRLDNHFETVAQANGQPLNDKRGGRSTMNKWDRQNDALRTMNEGIEKTKRAIEREKSKIANIERVNKVVPTEILDLVDEGTLNQWKKYPNTFFVEGVDKARIVWDNKKKVVAHRYLSSITDKEQRKKFAQIYNGLYRTLSGK